MKVTLYVPRMPTITTTTLPLGERGVVYNQTLNAEGTIQITWSLYSGSLPPGLTLYSSGLISGTPTLKGEFSFTVRA